MDSTAATDWSGRSQPGSVVGVSEAEGKIGTGLRFDGTNDYVLVDGFERGTGSLTVSAWAWAYTSAPNATIAKNWGETEKGEFQLGLSPQQSLAGEICESDGTVVTNQFGTKGDGKFSPGVWHHVALVAGSNVVKVYRDGLPASTSTVTAYDNTLNTNGIAVLGIGSRPGDSGGTSGVPWCGILDEVRVERCARSADWIVAMCRDGTGTLSVSSAMEVVPGDWTVDSDGDGMSDYWEEETFGGLGVSGPNDDYDSDRYPDKYEYVAGTSATNADSRFTVEILWTNGEQVIRYQTTEADGVGYDRSERRYDLQERPALDSGKWEPVQEPDQTNVLGQGQTVQYTNDSPAASGFFRAKVRLK
jgi:hypothetical protein